MPVFYLDLHLEIDIGDWLGTKPYERWDGFSFLIVKYVFVCSNIQAPPVFGVHISLLIMECQAYVSYDNLRSTRKLQSTRTNAEISTSNVFGRHDNLVNRYEMSVS